MSEDRYGGTAGRVSPEQVKFNGVYYFADSWGYRRVLEEEIEILRDKNKKLQNEVDRLYASLKLVRHHPYYNG